MTEKDRKTPPDVPPPAEPKKDRRGRVIGVPPKPKAVGSVGHDDLGNAVWEWRVDVPRRRDDDPTLDLVDCLDSGDLSLEEDDPEKAEDKFNPYNKRR